MPNFWGEAPDVVSWDYSMNEAGGDPAGLEAYLRHVMTLARQPKLIVKDTHLAVDRRRLLQHYYRHGAALTARDPVVLHTDPAARPYLDRGDSEAERPVGFRAWREFGGPRNAPGQSLHHPAAKEHELNAWLLTMHFLSALQVVAAAEDMDDDAEDFLYRKCRAYEEWTNRSVVLPEPLYAKAINATEPWNSILFGEPPLNGAKFGNWTMNAVRCRTSFEPIVGGGLSDIAVSGSVGENLDVMLPKSKMYYNSGWVLDLSVEEKKAKRNLDRFGGLGFVDSKKAYYGIYASGSLSFMLPIDGTGVLGSKGISPSVGEAAAGWFKSVVLCEVNEMRGPSACQTERDVRYAVGGVNATNVSFMDTAGTLYLGKKLCAHILVPATSVLTSRAAIASNNGDGNTQPMRSIRGAKINEQDVGLLVTATVHNNHIIQREEACSISHVIWEQPRFVDNVEPPRGDSISAVA